MVTPPLHPDEPDFYDALTDDWPGDPRSVRRARRKGRREVVLRGERLDTPDVARMSKALLLAQRELAKTQAEADARAQKDRHE